jgi:[protein-PII] uridylyltransferase
VPSLRELRAGLLEDRCLTGSAWCRKYAQVADAWLGSVFEEAVQREARGVALLAVGGYGRAHLAPGSDLDLALVYDGKRKGIKSIADAIWYPVWDSGMHLDHSVRTPKEMRGMMDADIKVAVGLLDARVVVGDLALGEEVLRRAMDMWHTRAGKWLPQLDSLTTARHARFGDLAFLLEPDIKEARGGTRDVDLIRSLAKVAPVLSDLSDRRSLEQSAEFLTAARVELQRLTGQSTNFLLLQDQDAVAAAMGADDADALMARVADAARAIAWAADDAWRRIRSSLAGPRGRGGGGDRVIEPGIVLRDEEVALPAEVDPAVDPTLPLRVAAVSAELDRPISRHGLDRLGKRSLAPDGVWPPAVLQSFLRLLGAGPPLVGAVEALDQQGVWLRYLPEWGPVRNRPQRNAYHRFTVDRHLLETVARAATMQSSVARPDMLLLAALLHDIGKGRGGDHTAIGVEVVGTLGPRLGLSPVDASLLQKLVRLHLLLPDVATRRDLDDPRTSQSVAESVGDHVTLELLAALTEADSMATGPAAWGHWKAGLVSRLVAGVSAVLEGRSPPDNRAAVLGPEQLALLRARRLELLADGGQVTVAAPDRPGLLAVVAGVLTLSGVNVRSATTMSDEGSGMAMLRFEVIPAFRELPDWDRVRAKLSAALEGRIDVDAQLARRDADNSRYRRATSAYLPPVEVLFDHDASDSSTVVEVRAPDRGPVLYRVADALTSCEVTITSALVSTLGAEAIDVFYVRALDGGRVGDPAHQSRMRAAVLAALA